MSQNKKFEFFDPHFHIFDVSQGAYLEGCLFKPYGQTVYTLEQYEKAVFDAGMELVGGVFVECASVCYKEKSGEEMNRTTSRAEVAWVREAVTVSNLPYGIVGNCCLEAGGESVKEWVGGVGKVVGVREILNYTPSYPRVDREMMKDEGWLEGLAVIEEAGLSFDLQLNPHQFALAHETFKSHPTLRIIFNHIGSPTPADLSTPSYWEGLTLLSTLPNLYVKISMLPDIASCADHVARVISIFTPARCMFASNHPVDACELKVPLAETFAAFKKFAEGYTEAERDRLFKGTAVEAYKMS